MAEKELAAYVAQQLTPLELTVLLYGSIAYAVVFTLAPALAYFIDKRG